MRFEQITIDVMENGSGTTGIYLRQDNLEGEIVVYFPLEQWGLIKSEIDRQAKEYKDK